MFGYVYVEMVGFFDIFVNVFVEVVDLSWIIMVIVGYEMYMDYWGFFLCGLEGVVVLLKILIMFGGGFGDNFVFIDFDNGNYVFEFNYGFFGEG